MNKTSIEWVKNPDGTQGYTWNPITGCLNHTPEGLCLGGMFPCYAYRLANGRLSGLYMNNGHLIDYDAGWNDPFYPRFWPERFKEFHRDTKQPKGIFVCDMGELFGDWVPPLWQERVFNEIVDHPQHRFYLLTKQPQNLVKFSPFPDNCWVGVTATNWQMTSDAIFTLGDKVKAKVKFISFEPLLESCIGVGSLYDYLNEGLWWLIIGAQTKPYKPPKIEWVEEIVEACDKAGIPVFLKDNLYNPMLANYHKTSKWGWREMRLRQELPK